MKLLWFLINFFRVVNEVFMVFNEILRVFNEVFRVFNQVFRVQQHPNFSDLPQVALDSNYDERAESPNRKLWKHSKTLKPTASLYFPFTFPSHDFSFTFPFPFTFPLLSLPSTFPSLYFLIPFLSLDFPFISFPLLPHPFTFPALYFPFPLLCLYLPFPLLSFPSSLKPTHCI